MTIHWSLFVPGMLFLLYPADRLLSSLVELRSFDCFQRGGIESVEEYIVNGSNG